MATPPGPAGPSNPITQLDGIMARFNERTSAARAFSSAVRNAAGAGRSLPADVVTTVQAVIDGKVTPLDAAEDIRASTGTDVFTPDLGIPGPDPAA